MLFSIMDYYLGEIISKISKEKCMNKCCCPHSMSVGNRGNGKWINMKGLVRGSYGASLSNIFTIA